MNKLIVIVGASGVGKTTLAQALSTQQKCAMALAQHSARPSQSHFKQDVKYALANQMDYLLYRAEQERELREGDIPALMDGGLDLDFYGFTRLFHTRGLLNDNEYDLIRRFFFHTRSLLPPPDLVVALSADAHIISQRLAARNRINIASSEDAGLLEGYVNEWLESIPEKNILRLNVSQEDVEFKNSVPLILDKIDQ